MKTTSMIFAMMLLSIVSPACKGDMDCDTDTCNLGTSTSAEAGDTGTDTASADTDATPHITCSTSTDGDPSTGSSVIDTTTGEPTTGDTPVCQGIRPGACAPTQGGWCTEVEVFCKAEALGESRSMLDWCAAIGDWCDFGADPCDMCASLEQQCIDELKPGESVELCFGIVAECMCLGIFHDEQF